MAWSDAARKAALEARRRNSKGGRTLRATGWSAGQVGVPFSYHYPAQLREETTYLVTKWDLDKAPIKRVKISSLTTIQERVWRDVVRKYAKKGASEPIKVARIGKLNYIVDGTHRTTAEWTKQRKTVLARVRRYPSIKDPPYDLGTARQMLIKGKRKLV